MATIKLRLNKTIKYTDGKSALVFQVLHDRRKKLVYTTYRMTENDFDPKTEKILSGMSSDFSHKEVTVMHRQLNKQKKELQQKIDKLDNEWGDYTVYDIISAERSKHKNYLLKSFDMQISRKQKEHRTGMAAAYRSTKQSLYKFLQGRDIDMGTINKRFISDYESLLVCRGISRNTIAFYIRNLRAVYNAYTGRDDKNLMDYPFTNIRTSPQATQKRALSKESLIKLVNLQFTSYEKHLEFARDIFLFSFYTRGMSLVDMIYLKDENIQNNIIVYQRKKSKQLLQIAVNEPLQKIMDKYQHPGGYILPILDSLSEKSLYHQYRMALTRINRNLKIVGERINCGITLTSYVARHSWATQAKTLGAPIGVISQGLGHSSETITRIYLKDLDTSIIDKVNEEIIKLK